MDLQLDGKRALVTGSSAGIGLSIARNLVKEGVHVMLCGRHQSRLDAAAAVLRNEVTGGRVATVSADVTSLPTIGAMADEVRKIFGGLDILVNNAGTGIYKPFFEITDEELVHGMQMNFLSMFRVTQRILPIMLDSGGGAIVNITGISGSSVMDPPFFSTCSGPAKAAENRFTKALAMEFGPRNIRVNSVAPGRIHAPERFARWCDDIAIRSGQTDLTPQDLQREWGKRISMVGNRWGDVEEIAKLVVFAASPVCAFMNGAVLVADGGETRD